MCPWPFTQHNHTHDTTQPYTRHNSTNHHHITNHIINHNHVAQRLKHQKNRRQRSPPRSQTTSDSRLRGCYTQTSGIKTTGCVGKHADLGQYNNSAQNATAAFGFSNSNAIEPRVVKLTRSRGPNQDTELIHTARVRSNDRPYGESAAITARARATAIRRASPRPNPRARACPRPSVQHARRRGPQ